MRLHVEGAVEDVLRLEQWQRREGRRETVILRILEHDTQLDVEVIGRTNQQCRRATAGGGRALIARAGARN